MSATAILRLEIRRFRGIRSLDWEPDPRLNIVLGAADSGKSTVLEAIALLFSAAPNFGLSEFDYHERDVDAGFTIEAVLAVADVALLRDAGFPAPPMRGWLAGKVTDLPDEHGAQPVIVCRLTGTADQETVYEVIGAGGEVRTPFSRAMRRRISLARLGVADRGDRDIRLVQGGALDRYLQGQDVRQTVLQAVMKTPLHDQLDAGPRKALEEISKGFAKRNLPHPVRLGLVGTPGVSLAASVGLTVGAGDPDSLPLAAWGTGTRRLAALEISNLGVRADAMAVIDEPETGLEPYRQRVFIRDLAATARQAFVTTHAPAVLAQSANETGQLWRMGIARPGWHAASEEADAADQELASHALFEIAGDELAAVASSQPETLFARLPIVCEGVTEVGFATRMLEHRFGAGFSCRGVYCLDAGGHYRALPIAQALLTAGFEFAAIIDDEGKKGGSWSQLAGKAILLRWANGACLETAILSVMPDASLQQAHEWAEQASHRDAKHQLAEIRRELGLDKGMTVADMFVTVGRQRYLNALLKAACPTAEGSRKPRGWFKSFDGGYLLADKLLSLTPGSEPEQMVETFLSAIGQATEP